MIEDLNGLARIYLDILQNPPKLREAPNEVVHDSERARIYSAFAVFIKDHPRVSLEDYFAPPSEEEKVGHLDREGRETLARRLICREFAAELEPNVGYNAARIVIGEVMSGFKIVDYKTIGAKLLGAAVIEAIQDPRLRYLAMKRYPT